MHLPQLIVDLALVLAVAAVAGIICRYLKQPVVLGYIIAGLLVGPYFQFLPTVMEIGSIKTWAEIGVIILLFNLGLEFSFKKILKEGPRIIVIALFGVLFTLLSGFILGQLLGWNNTDSIFFGGILCIASTTIIIRAFDELGVKSQRFTNVVTSVLIVEDIVAVVLMVILTSISISHEFEGLQLILSITKLVVFLILWFIAGIFFLPGILRFLKSTLNEEILLMLALALCFGVVIMALKIGFSPAFGAFIMGSILAETTKAERIEHLIAPLKNLFGAIFFVSVGMLLNPDMIIKNWIPVLFATIILLIGKPTFIFIGSLITGQPLKMALQSGLSLSQIGEFSFIIATLGLSLNVVSDFLYPVAVAVSVLTTFTTPYMIKLNEPVYAWAMCKLPPKWIKNLEAYSVSTERIVEISEWNKLVRSTFLNSLLFSLIIITIILINVKLIQPLFWEQPWSRLIVAGITILLISPFLWALAFRKGNKEIYAKIWAKKEYRSPLQILQISRIALALMYIGFLFDRLFSPVVALFGVLFTLLLLYLFAKRIQQFYGRIEVRFLTNLRARESDKSEKLIHLTPWDAHLSTFALTAHVPFIGKTLLESKIREVFGVNVASILRDDVTINVPSRHERLYPHDVISVIGTDEQLIHFKEFLAKSEVDTEIVKSKNEIKLLHFTLHEDSQLIGKSIKDSNIRELSKGLIVGIERNGRKILNPESNSIFEENDLIWIVGNEKRVKILAGENRTK